MVTGVQTCALPIYLDSDAKFPERNVFVVLGVDRAGFAAHITEALSSYAG